MTEAICESQPFNYYELLPSAGRRYGAARALVPTLGRTPSREIRDPFARPSFEPVRSRWRLARRFAALQVGGPLKRGTAGPCRGILSRIRATRAPPVGRTKADVGSLTTRRARATGGG